MKVAIISRHSVANYGSFWQAYALQTAIENLGYQAVNINYTPKGEVSGNLANNLVKISRWGKNPFTRLLFMAYQFPSFTHTFNKFKKYREVYLKETKEYTSGEELRYSLPEADVYCTGSDQVWNLIYNNAIDDNYFLSFLPKDKRRFSYAASFGGNSFENEDKAKYVELLKRYKAVTVREDRGVDILHQLGISGMQVLDPTLLLDENKWNSIVPEKKLAEEPYLMIYQLRPNKAFDDYAEALAKKEKQKLIRVSPMFFQIVKCGQFRYLPKPEEFLWYIKHTSCLLTDSFHGTCFAVNFRRKFIEILPGRFNERNESLLRTIGLEDRILKDYSNFELFERNIDYEKVHNILLEHRIKSMDALKNMIEEK